MQHIQRRLTGWGATLFAIGLFTGLWSAAALSGVVILRIPRLALAAHLNALLGGLWCIAVAFTFPMLRYSALQLRRLTLLVVVPAWANWLITLIASFAGENGLQYRGEWKNDAIAFGLQVLVVLPSLVGGIYWVRGFCRQGETNG